MTKWKRIDQQPPPWSDDLIWLCREDYPGSVSIEGPRLAQLDDIDYWTHWAPCEHPDVPFRARVDRTGASG